MPHLSLPLPLTIFFRSPLSTNTLYFQRLHSSLPHFSPSHFTRCRNKFLRTSHCYSITNHASTSGFKNSPAPLLYHGNAASFESHHFKIGQIREHRGTSICLFIACSSLSSSLFLPPSIHPQSSPADQSRLIKIPRRKTPKLPLSHPRSAVLPLPQTMTPPSPPRSALPQRKRLLLPTSKSIPTPTVNGLSLSLLLPRSVLRQRRRTLLVSLTPIPRPRAVRQMERLRALSRSLLRRESAHLRKAKPIMVPRLVMIPPRPLTSLSLPPKAMASPRNLLSTTPLASVRLLRKSLQFLAVSQAPGKTPTKLIG